MVVLIRCNDIISDTRAMKYVRFYQEKGIEHFLIGWDRERKMEQIPNAIMWGKKAGYNIGGFKAVKNRIGWMYFVFKQLRQIKPKDIVLHGCDLDSAFPAALYKFFNCKAKLIFDIFDWFSATLYDQKPYILKAFGLMERFTVKQSDYIIICEPERTAQVPYPISNEKLLLLPNIPYFQGRDFLCTDESMYFKNNRITFSYVGGFAQDRCINEIITLAEKGDVNLLIAGYGDKQIEDRLEMLKASENIKYFGKVDYQRGLNIMFNSDIIYAMYAKTNPNNLYAAPNKYYEAMFLSKPIFTTKGTIVETKVLNNHFGYVSDERIDNILEVIEGITHDQLQRFGTIAGRLWDDTYKEYTSSWLNNEYKRIIS